MAAALFIICVRQENFLQFAMDAWFDLGSKQSVRFPYSSALRGPRFLKQKPLCSGWLLQGNMALPSLRFLRKLQRDESGTGYVPQFGLPSPKSHIRIANTPIPGSMLPGIWNLEGPSHIWILWIDSDRHYVGRRVSRMSRAESWQSFHPVTAIYPYYNHDITICIIKPHA